MHAHVAAGVAARAGAHAHAHAPSSHSCDTLLAHVGTGSGGRPLACNVGHAPLAAALRHRSWLLCSCESPMHAFALQRHGARAELSAVIFLRWRCAAAPVSIHAVALNGELALSSATPCKCKSAGASGHRASPQLEQRSPCGPPAAVTRVRAGVMLTGGRKQLFMQDRLVWQSQRHWGRRALLGALGAVRPGRARQAEQLSALANSARSGKPATFLRPRRRRQTLRPARARPDLAPGCTRARLELRTRVLQS